MTRDVMFDEVIGTIQPERGHAWHGGPTPLGALRGVDAEMAAWKPGRGRNSIWDLTLHVAYWKHMVRQRIEGGRLPAFPRKPANWPSPPDSHSEEAWKADIQVLRQAHESLLETIASVDRSRLGRAAKGKPSQTVGELIAGIAFHDVYHTGQIQVVKKLWEVRHRG
jgi:uncharacterized damage-inducible protein DinB